jgi:hypothetical protein
MLKIADAVVVTHLPRSQSQLFDAPHGSCQPVATASLARLRPSQVRYCVQTSPKSAP